MQTSKKKNKSIKPGFEENLSFVSRLNWKPGGPALILRKEATEYHMKNKTKFRKRGRQKDTNLLVVLRCYLLGEDKRVRPCTRHVRSRAGLDAVRKRKIYFSCRIIWPLACSWNRLHLNAEIHKLRLISLTHYVRKLKYNLQVLIKHLLCATYTLLIHRCAFNTFDQASFWRTHKREFN